MKKIRSKKEMMDCDFLKGVLNDRRNYSRGMDKPGIIGNHVYIDGLYFWVYGLKDAWYLEDEIKVIQKDIKENYDDQITTLNMSHEETVSFILDKYPN